MSLKQASTIAEMRKEFSEAANELIRFGMCGLRGRILRRRLLFGIPFGLFWTLRRFRITSLLEAEYHRILPANWRLSELERNEAAPQFHILSTSLTTGELVDFSQEGVRRGTSGADWTLVGARSPRAALAVAASSAFPPMFPPVELTYQTVGASKMSLGADRLHLTDGGIYDNVGISIALADAEKSTSATDHVFVISDASAPFDWEIGTRFSELIPRTVRTTDILMKRVADFEKNAPIGIDLEEAKRRFWISISESVGPRSFAGALDKTLQANLKNLRTDLDQFHPTEIGALIAHGYGLAHKMLTSLTSDSISDNKQRPIGEFNLTPEGLGKSVWRIDRGSRRRLGIFDLRDWTTYLIVPLVVLLLLFVLTIMRSYIYRQTDFETQRAQAEIVSRLSVEQAQRATQLDLREQQVREREERLQRNQSPLPQASTLQRQTAVTRSGPRPSGLGRSFSDEYTVCSEPLPNGARVISQRFVLTGDRSCGAWSMCTQLPNTADNRVCWSFRLQGHDEWFPPRPAFSEGVLEVTYEAPAR